MAKNTRSPEDGPEEEYDVEESTDTAALVPLKILDPETALSGPARSILIYAFSLPQKPTKKILKRLAGFEESSWIKYTKELVEKGWLERRNLGGKGRGNWSHTRTFFRSPRKNPLLD